MTAFSELGKSTRGVWTRREALAVASRSQIGRLLTSGSGSGRGRAYMPTAGWCWIRSNEHSPLSWRAVGALSPHLTGPAGAGCELLLAGGRPPGCTG